MNSKPTQVILQEMVTRSGEEMDYRQMERFESREAILRYIQEKSDDIENVEILQHSTGTITYLGLGLPIRNAGAGVAMVVFCVDGTRLLIHRDAAESILNDGIFNRMSIPITIRSS